MTMVLDISDRPAAAPAPGAGNHVGSSRDWHGLRARLIAGYAARGALACEEPRESAASGGSFDGGSARTLCGYGRGQQGGQDGINPTALANGNSGQDNHATVAGASSVGD